MALTPEQIIEARKKYGIDKPVLTSDSQSADEKMNFLNSDNSSTKETSTNVDVFKGAGKGALETLQNIGNVVAKPLGKAMGIPENEIGIPEETLKATNTLQKIGKGIERIVEFAIPLSKVSTATKSLPFVQRVLARTIADIGVLSAQEGKFKLAQQGGISLASQAIPGTLKVGAKYLSNIFKRGAGLLTSKGSEVVEQVLKDPELAMQGIKGDPVQVLRSGAKSVVDFTKNFAKSAKQTYSNTLDDIEKNYTEVLSNFRVSKKDGMTLINPQTGTSIIKDPNGNNFNLSLGSLKKYVTGGLKDFNVSGSTKSGFDFSNSSLNQQEEAVMSRVVNKFSDWTDITPSGLNRLSQIIEGYARAESPSLKRANAIIYKVVNSIDDYVAERVPGIREMNNEYKTAMQFIQQLENQMGQITGKSVTPELIDQVSRKVANLFTANKQIARDVISKMTGGEDLLSIEAGREMAQGISRTSASIGDRVGGLIQTIVPPERVAQVTAWVGKQGKKAEPFVNALEKAEPTMRKVLVDALSGIFSEEE